jgi:hypothetical protein
MAVLKRIGPGSAFKVGLVSYGVVGLVAGIFCSLVVVTGTSFAPHAHIPFMGTIGVLAVVVCPIVWGILGGIGAVISVLIYNLAAGWVGGVEVDIN